MLLQGVTHLFDLVEKVGNVEMKNKYVKLICYYMTFVETKDVQ
jgi:hypothetical protein